MSDPDSSKETTGRPTVGMSLFESSEHNDWQANADLPTDPDWAIYKYGYQLAADVLMKHTSSGIDQDFLIYPILFTARQAIELGLKELIRLGMLRSEGRESHPNTHDVWKLWRSARRHLEEAGMEPGEDVDAFEALLKELANADPGSMTFRYPVDKTDKPAFGIKLRDGRRSNDSSITMPATINTGDIKTVLRAMFRFLDGCHDWLEDVIQVEQGAFHDLSAGDEC